MFQPSQLGDAGFRNGPSTVYHSRFSVAAVAGSALAPSLPGVGPFGTKVPDTRGPQGPFHSWGCDPGDLPGRIPMGRSYEKKSAFDQPICSISQKYSTKNVEMNLC